MIGELSLLSLNFIFEICQSSMVFCAYCGKETPENIKFCPFCGSSTDKLLNDGDDARQIKRDRILI